VERDLTPSRADSRFHVSPRILGHELGGKCAAATPIGSIKRVHGAPSIPYMSCGANCHASIGTGPNWREVLKVLGVPAKGCSSPFLGVPVSCCTKHTSVARPVGAGRDPGTRAMRESQWNSRGQDAGGGRLVPIGCGIQFATGNRRAPHAGDCSDPEPRLCGATGRTPAIAKFDTVPPG